MRRDRLLIFSGTAHPQLTNKICEYLNISQGKVFIDRFPDKEVDVKVESDVRGADVFIVQPTCCPANENLMELLILIDCLRRASADRITAVIPYYGYARKDRKDEGRVPITAKLVANLLVNSGVNRVLTVDLHAAQIQGFFDIPVDHLLAGSVFVPYFESLKIPDLVVVSPDVGSLKQARSYAKRLNGDLAIVDKRRESAEKVSSLNIIGDVNQKNALLVDDMISTGGSIAEACRFVKKQGAKKIYICATHPVLCGDATEKLRTLPVEEIVVSDSIPITGSKQLDNLKVISLAPMLGECIRRINNSESVSYLFQYFGKS
ncbi:ribose-phosphate diphosphokinase [Candidatus Uabimicrobium sp. HlEnr_7]|uniref:ribose-phosphate diphosphokinase n=1 Tax=Candidatus Uabimicrobium helgolandensis TaxID=3095367 RepID=UPI003557173F